MIGLEDVAYILHSTEMNHKRRRDRRAPQESRFFSAALQSRPLRVRESYANPHVTPKCIKIQANYCFR